MMAFTGNTLRKTTVELNLLGNNSQVPNQVMIRLGEVGATIIRVKILDDVNLTGYSFGFEALVPGNALIQDENQDNFRQVAFNEFEYKCNEAMSNFVGTTQYAYFTIFKDTTERVTTQNFYIHALSSAENDADFVQENYISLLNKLAANSDDSYMQAIQTRQLIDSNEVLTSQDLNYVTEQLNELETLKREVADLKVKLDRVSKDTTTDFITNEELVLASRKMENKDLSQYGKLLNL